jgi:hypothetical protein
MALVDFAQTNQVTIEAEIMGMPTVRKATHFSRGWNVHLASVSFMDSQQVGRIGVEATIAENGKAWMLGLAKDDWDLHRAQHYGALDHAIYLDSNGNANVHEAGTQVSGFFRYNPDEQVSLIKNELGFIEYKLAGHTFHTSVARAHERLHVKICVHDHGRVAGNVRWILHEDQADVNVEHHVQHNEDQPAVNAQHDGQPNEYHLNQEQLNQDPPELDDAEHTEEQRREEGPEYFPLTPGLGTPDLAMPALVANCYLPHNTAFKKSDGQLVLAEHVRQGDQLRMWGGTVVTVVEMGRHMRQEEYPYALVHLSTNQGSFKLSAGCRIEVVGQRSETLRANMLRTGDRVTVGTEVRSLTKVQHYKERAELIWLRFEPDVSVETFYITNWGLQTKGEQPNSAGNGNFSWVSIVPESVLNEAAWEDYSD